MKEKRLHYMDVAKGLLIMMVVYGHLYGSALGINNAGINYLHQVNNFFISFYMPCFFIITGYCSNFSTNRNSLEFLKSSFLTILFPGITLSLLITFLRDFSIDALKSYLYDILYYGGRYWFLTVLFLARILFLFAIA